MAEAHNSAEGERLRWSPGMPAILGRTVIIAIWLLSLAVALIVVLALIVVVTLSASSGTSSNGLDGENEKRKKALSWDHPPDSTGDRWVAAVGEIVLPMLFGDSTVYSTDFKESAFRDLPMGVRQSIVRTKLGSPISIKVFPDGDVCWYYSEAGSPSGNYFVRVLIFDASGGLVDRHADFYVDF